jgi:hypothetical protein
MALQPTEVRLHTEEVPLPGTGIMMALYKMPRQDIRVLWLQMPGAAAGTREWARHRWEAMRLQQLLMRLQQLLMRRQQLIMRLLQ